MPRLKQAVGGLTAVLLGVGVLPAALAPQATAAVGQGFNLNRSDVRFILAQIKIAEQHAETATADNPCGTLLGTGPDQIPNQNSQGAELPWGLRTVDGSCNNLKPNQETFGASDQMFPRMTVPEFRDADDFDPDGPGPAPGTPTSYKSKSGLVVDTQPRRASNLIVDQTTSNPAAVAAAGEGAVPDPGNGTLFIENVTPDVGLSAPFNSVFTLFGQFFDHGLDLTNKSGGTVFMPLDQDDPLYDPNSNLNFMVLTRTQNLPGRDGVLGTADDVQDGTNQTSPYVDQSQTYASHPSHHVFLREYENDAAGKPVTTGKMLEGSAQGGLATWASVKAQARALLGIDLTDMDVLNLPLLATDPYGKFERGPNGYPQIVLDDDTVVEGDPAANGGTGVPVPADAVRSNHAFLDDIAHHAVPEGDPDGPTGPAPRGPLTPDADPGTTDDNDPSTYDDEMLDAHFITGDGRTNENIGLTAVHNVFHGEHNRLVGDVQRLITEEDPGQLSEWQLADGSWNGERLFQAARFVTEMEYQHLAFEEFARKVQPQVNVFSGYDTSIDAAITAEFAHTVYRFGHSMLTETVSRKAPGGANRDIPLLEAFLNPPSFQAGGLTPQQATGDVMRGMSDQVGNEIDEFVTEALRNELLGLPLDLATINMARGRDAGIPRLNEARRQFFAQTRGNSALRPYANWIDFGLELKHPESLINFVAAYGLHPTITDATTLVDKRAAAALLVAGDTQNPDTPEDAVAFMNGIRTTITDPVTGEVTETGNWVNQGGRTTTGLDDVDFWVGGLAEKQSPFGGLLGPTMNFVFETQMEDLQDGDRFYYLSRTAGLNLLVQLEGNSLSEMISRTSNAANLPADVFARPDYTFNLEFLGTSGPIQDDPATEYNESTLLMRSSDGTIRYTGDKHVNFIGTAGTDKIWSSEGDDTLRGNDADDVLEGGSGNDQIIGGLGQDIITDTFGDDTTKGGDGNDAISSGAGFDLNQGGRGNDFVVGGSDPTETFGGPGNDMIFAGDSADTVFGDDGDDWIEGGGQADLLQGDNGAPFQDDPNAPGHDVLNGNGGADDYDAEGGDDIMVSGPGVERNEGMLGFDWVTHKNNPQAANDNMGVTGLLPPSVDALRDRFDLVEGLSGWDHDDLLIGDDEDLAGGAGIDNELTAEGIARINGLADLLAPGATGFTGGNIIIGGAGSDRIEPRGGDDLVDGDSWLDVQLEAPDLSTPDPADTKLVDEMFDVQAEVFSGAMNAGDIRIVRTIRTPDPGTAVDTAAFRENLADYSIDVAADGTVTVANTGGTQIDGSNTLRNIERLEFADQTIDVADLAANNPATGEVALDSSTPVEDVDITASVGTVADVDGLPTDPTAFTFTWEAETAPDVWEVVGNTATFNPGLEEIGMRLRATVTFQDAAGFSESVTSAPTEPVAAAAAAVAPGAPTDVSAVPAAQSATVSWTAPADAGGTGITGYLVEALTGGTVADSVEVGAVTSTVFGGLTNGTAYTFRVSAINAVGTGDASAPSAAVTPSGVAARPSAPSGTTVTGTSGATATITWQAPASDGGSPITDYRVIATRVDGAGNPLRTTRSVWLAPDTFSHDMGVGVAGDYRFQVIARNAIGISSRSTSTAVVALGAATRPGAPFIGTASVGSGTVPGITADVTWTPPVADGGSPVTGYRVLALRLNDAGGVAATTRSTWQPGDARSFEMEVPVAATYVFQVISRNDIGTSRRSARSNQIALGAAAPATPPAAPRIGTATDGTAGGDVTVSATWTEPTTDGGSAITGYRGIFLRLGADGQVLSTTRSPWQPATARAVEQTLPVQGTYVVQVVARNDIGVSRRSVRSNQVTGQ